MLKQFNKSSFPRNPPETMVYFTMILNLKSYLIIDIIAV